MVESMDAESAYERLMMGPEYLILVLVLENQSFPDMNGLMTVCVYTHIYNILSKYIIIHHIIYNYVMLCYVMSLQLCPTLCDPIDGSPTGSTVPGILQARTLEWVAISFSNA